MILATLIFEAHARTVFDQWTNWLQLAAWSSARLLGKSIKFFKEVAKDAVPIDRRCRCAVEMPVRIKAPGVVIGDDWCRLKHCRNPLRIDHPAAPTARN